MYYYEVAPATNKYHGSRGLTYSSARKLTLGQLISVAIRQITVAGFIIATSPRPDFKVRPLTEILAGLRLPPASLELFQWIQDYYPGPIGPLASQFVPATILTTSKPLSARPLLPLPPVDTSRILTADQRIALQTIQAQAAATFLLHGETGTGKTRVYVELARQTLASGQSSLILTPEIALTPQLVNVFTREFGDHVAVTHSSMSPLQRKNLWLRLRSADTPSILIGPRSALFMPLHRPGLIVIDEFHDSAYKQESTPRYHATRVASRLASIHRATLILGSATPSIYEYFVAEHKKIPILRMTTKPSQKATISPRLTTHVANLADSSEKTKHPLLSTTLLRELAACLARGEQALIFLNKRGSARAIICQTCGWQATCPHCDLPLTYHDDTHTLLCHTCGSTQDTPLACPSCRSVEIFFKSPGTKAIVSSLTSLFPEARIARFDKDNKAGERIEARHADVVDGSIDILVGTQLLSKGHDLPQLSLVGIVLAESGLSFPDYTSEERSFQIIRQLCGRVGRGHRPGVVVLQTFDPDNPTIRAALSGSWDDFYTKQLAERRNFGFPPFFHVMKVELARASAGSAEAATKKLMRQVDEAHTGISLIGPSPSFREKHGGRWHWQFIIKAKQRTRLVTIAKALPRDCLVDIDPDHLL